MPIRSWPFIDHEYEYPYARTNTHREWEEWWAELEEERLWRIWSPGLADLSVSYVTPNLDKSPWLPEGERYNSLCNSFGKITRHENHVAQYDKNHTK